MTFPATGTRGAAPAADDPVDTGASTRSRQGATGQGLGAGVGESGDLARATAAGLYRLRPGLATVLDALLSSDLPGEDQRMLMAMVREMIDADLRHPPHVGPGSGVERDYVTEMNIIHLKYEALGQQIDALHAKVIGDSPPSPPAAAIEMSAVDERIDAKLSAFKESFKDELRAIIREELQPQEPDADPAPDTQAPGDSGR